MKSIKRFHTFIVESIDTIGYEEITNDEYNEILYGEEDDREDESDHIKKIRQKFTKSEIDKIQSFFKKKIKISRKDDWTKDEICIEWDHKESFDGIYITKHSDEWFFLDDQIGDKDGKNQVCYRCDQFDGLLNLLSKIHQEHPSY